MFNKKIVSLAVVTSMSLGMMSVIPKQVEAARFNTQVVQETTQSLKAQIISLQKEIKILKSEDARREVIRLREEIELLQKEINELKNGQVNIPKEESPQVPQIPEAPQTPEIPQTEETAQSTGGVDVKEFGVKANANYYNQKDGNYYVDQSFTTPATDDTKAINAAIKYASQNGIKNVNIPNGKYLIDAEGKNTAYVFEQATNGGIQLESNITLNMSDATTLVTNTVNNQGYSLITVNKKENVEILGGNLVGDMNTHPYDNHNYCHGISIANGSDGVLVKNVNITQMEDDGIMIADYLEHLSDGKKTNDVEIRNVKSHNNGRQGLTISTGTNIVVADSEFSNQRKHSPMSGIDIELESFDHGGVKNVEITGSTFKNNTFSGIVVSDMFNDKPASLSQNVNINNNTIENNRFGVIASGKIDGLNISDNNVYIDHLVNEFSAGIGSTSTESSNVSIKNNTVTSKDKNNFSIGVINISPGALINDNSLTGQRKALVSYGTNPIISDNMIADAIDIEIEGM